jgi:hypothetical protein
LVHHVVEITLGDGYDIVHPPFQFRRSSLNAGFDERSGTLQCPVAAAIPTSRLGPFGTLINHKDTAVKVPVHP